MDDHINFVIHTISQRFCLLHQLKKQRLSMSALNIIFKALTVSRSSTLQSFWLCLALTWTDSTLPLKMLGDRASPTLIWQRRIDMIWRWYMRIRSTDQTDRRPFYNTRLSHHCLNQLLAPPSPATHTNNLRPRGHTISSPPILWKVLLRSSVPSVNYNCNGNRKITEK